ncbi:arginase family protein [Leifsonia sp. NPDC102414]|uniref:arginase family protein n=1 Tax=Leifsonia sp. NPDC102414 TaxID=3364124 RepID=UPI0038064A67
MTAKTLTVIGAPSSAGSYAAGQEQAPRVLREHGLLERLRARGIAVLDSGDGPLQVWAPDRAHPLAQNVGQVAESVLAVSEATKRALAQTDAVLVLGGNCLVTLGVMRALTEHDPAPGLLYADRHSDLNTPATTTDGALDWMGVAHLLGVEGATSELLDALGRSPFLAPSSLHLFGIDPDAATPGERRIRDGLGLTMTTADQLRDDPAAAARAAVSTLPDGPLAVHLDVDLLDFTDAPIAEDTGGRNTGPTLAEAMDALRVATHDPRFRALSVGELNPTRAAGDPAAIDRFADALAGLF